MYLALVYDKFASQNHSLFWYYIYFNTIPYQINLVLLSSDPKITFPVVSPKTPNELKAHPDVIAKTRKLEDKVKLLEATKTKISQEEKVREELYEKFNKRKRKFEEISEIVTQPRGNELAIRRTPVKEEMLDP